MLLAGMLLLFYGPSLPDVTVIILLLVLVPVCYRSRIYLIRLLATFCLAYGWAGLHALHSHSQELPGSVVNQPLQVSGCILGLKIHSADYQRLLVDVTQVSHNGERVDFSGKASLSYYNAANNRMENGWCGEMKARLKPVHGRLNRRGFDYEAWAYVQDIKALGTIKEIHEIGPGNGVLNRYRLLRSSAIDKLSHALQQGSSFGLVLSLALGERDDIPADHWKVLRHSGTSHLLAISGLHIGLVFWFVSTISTLIWRSCAGLSLFVAAQKAGWLSGLIVSGGYLLLAGCPLSGRRAWVMLACCVLLWLCDKRIDFRHALALALWVILLIWPNSVLSIGFWFSYVAVALILTQFVHLEIKPAARQGLRHRSCLDKIKSLVKMQCLLSVAIMPLTVIYFGEISLVSPLANLFAVPLVSFLILPLILAGTVFLFAGWQALSQPLLGLAAFGLDGLFSVLSFFSALGGSVFLPQIEYSYSWSLLLLGGFVILVFSRWPGRWMVCLLIVPLIVNSKNSMRPGEYALTVFDVGQGLSVWIKSPNHNMLVDTGFGLKNGFNYFDSVIYPVLKSAGVDKLDVLVLSHGDADHAGGLHALKRSDMEVTQIYSSAELANTIGDYCDPDISWQWDGVRFRFLTREYGSSDNNQSCVLRVHSGLGSALLPGDIESQSELQLVMEYPHLLNVDLLIVPHHGSATSSTPHFLTAVSPSLAVISAGYLNRYGHPAPWVVERYQKRDIKLLNTACGGEITIHISEQGTEDHALRPSRQPFWRHQC